VESGRTCANKKDYVNNGCFASNRQEGIGDLGDGLVSSLLLDAVRTHQAITSASRESGGEES
jgi:hypothetical protein